MREYKAKNPDKLKQYNAESGKNWRQKLKEEIFDHYGRECACCGEDDPRALTVDHINGGGRKARQSGMEGHHHIGRWLRANDWPKGVVQILCWNCNSIKHFYPNQICH